MQLGANGERPDKQMRSMSSSLKADLQAGNLKVQTIVEQFKLKLTARNSHQHNAIEGEVRLPIYQYYNKALHFFIHIKIANAFYDRKSLKKANRRFLKGVFCLYRRLTYVNL